MPLYELIEAGVFAAQRIHGYNTKVPVRANVKSRTGRHLAGYSGILRPTLPADISAKACANTSASRNQLTISNIDQTMPMFAFLHRQCVSGLAGGGLHQDR